MLNYRAGIYSPEELLLFRRVFETALASLPLPMRGGETRAHVARNILDCAATGERDPIELGIAALGRLKVAA
jgi:hypothetical protein